MKAQHLIRILASLLTLLPAAPLLAQGTAFTYQGRVMESNAPANAIFEFEFTLRDSASGNNNLGVVTVEEVPVTNGLFTVTLDFGVGVFNGQPRWLEIQLRNDSANGNFVTLSPRTRLLPSPYAIMANTASNVLGTLPASQLSGTILNASLPASPNFSGTVTATGFAGNGANVTNVNAATLGGLTTASFWKTNGNAGANPASGAFLGNTDDLPFELRVNNQRAVRIEPATNVTYGFSPNIMAGFSGNTISNGFVGAVISGGGYVSFPNRVGNHFAAVLGGRNNTASGFASTAMGNHSISSGNSAVAMGFSTEASGAQSVAMGNYTIASGSGSSAMGTFAWALHDGTFVWADQQFVDFSSTAANQFLVRASGGVGINTNNPGSFALAVRGDTKVDGSFVGGNSGNIISNGVVGGFIGGGGNASFPNCVGGDYASVLGGVGNVASGLYSTAMGFMTTANGYFSTAMGYGTAASGVDSTAMGDNTTASGGDSTAMGYNTTASGDYSTAMGYDSTASGNYSTAMGISTASGDYSTAMGISTASGDYSTAMGISTVASGNTSTAMGFRAKANHDGTFVWADSQFADFTSTANNQFLIRASGGVGIGTTIPSTLLQVGGATCNGSTWNNSSDRNLKENLKAVNAQALLEKVAALPLSEWNYKTDSRTRHIGPMAQDFHAAFGLNGTNDIHIATVDADGVALAAIQGLNEKVEVSNQNSKIRIQKLEAENTALKSRLEKIEKLLQNRSGS